MAIRSMMVWASLLVLGSGVSAIATPQALFNPRSSAVLIAQLQPDSSLPQSLEQKVRSDLARRLNVMPQSLQLVEATPQTWPDQCLGLARPTERCQGGNVEGWQIHMASAQQTWIYRSDRTGRRLRLEPLAGTADFGRGDFSIETSRTLLKTVAQQVNQPMAKLQILDLQPAVWDGCLGIYQPEQVCTQIAIAGFRAVISDGQTLWVYHLSEDATQVAQNSTASGATVKIQASFLPLPTEPDFESELPADVIFQSRLSGDLAGSVQTIVLTADGTLYREDSRLRTSLFKVPNRTPIKKLSGAEVEAFQQVLQDQRFPNLNRMRYLTEAAFADYPTTQFQAPGVTVEYIDLELESLPPALKSIIAEWEAIASP